MNIGKASDKPTLILVSKPEKAQILLNMIPTGWYTPHTVSLAEFKPGEYSVQLKGYAFKPEKVLITKLTEETRVEYLGEPLSPALTINSRPTGAGIWRNGVFTGFRTPHTFSQAEFLPGDYSVLLEGFTFTPAVCTVNTLTGPITLNFEGTPVQKSLTVTSDPPGARILRNGVFTGYLTPHTFSSGSFLPGDYSVQLAGFVFSPEVYTVNSLPSNTAINFEGAPAEDSLTVLSTPAAAMIQRNGMLTGQVTPHTFAASSFLPGDYSVQLSGHSFTPEAITVNILEGPVSIVFTEL